MRVLLKFILALLLIYIFFNFSSHDYTSRISQLDSRIRDLISAFGIQEKDLIVSVKKSFQKNNKKFFYLGRQYRISSDFPESSFESAFKNLVKKLGFKFKKEKGRECIRYNIFLGNVVVYTLNLKPNPNIYMAVVIDDWGYTPGVIPFLQDIKIPLNIAILPQLDYSRTVNVIALNAGHEVLLHLPLQPLPGENMESHLEKLTIRKEMSSEKVNKVLNQLLDSLQDVKGVNNHMGSLISRDREKLQEIFTVLKTRGLYYLDSKVIPDSVAPQVAKKVGIKCFQRDVFIDNRENEEYIKAQIRKGIKISQKKGYSIIIGHARYTTLKVIKEMVPEITRYTIAVKLSNLNPDESTGH